MVREEKKQYNNMKEAYLNNMYRSYLKNMYTSNYENVDELTSHRRR